MNHTDAAYQLSALRRAVFGAIETWNSAHPHPLRSHREHGSVNVVEAYVDGAQTPSYSIAIVCALAGAGQHHFHGHDLADVAEQARLTVETKIVVELQRRGDRDRDFEIERRYGVAV